MKNVKASVDGNTLTIQIDLSQRLGVSTSGKSETIASTSGNVDAGSIPGLPPGVKLGLNCYASKK